MKIQLNVPSELEVLIECRRSQLGLPLNAFVLFALAKECDGAKAMVQSITRQSISQDRIIESPRPLEIKKKPVESNNQNAEPIDWKAIDARNAIKSKAKHDAYLAKIGAYNEIK